LVDEENKAAEEAQTTEVKEEVKEEKIEEPKAETPKEGTKGGKGKAILAVIAVILLIIIVTKLSGSKGGGSVTTPTPTPTQQIQVYKLGEEITAGSATITVNKKQVSKGTAKSKPAEGSQWLNVNLTIENGGVDKQDIVSVGTMTLRESAGTSYQSVVTDKTGATLSIDGTVLAKAKRTGWVGFEIPTTATGLQFEYNAVLFGGGPILVDLGQ